MASNRKPVIVVAFVVLLIVVSTAFVSAQSSVVFLAHYLQQ